MYVFMYNSLQSRQQICQAFKTFHFQIGATMKEQTDQVDFQIKMCSSFFAFLFLSLLPPCLFQEQTMVLNNCVVAKQKLAVNQSQIYTFTCYFGW